MSLSNATPFVKISGLPFRGALLSSGVMAFAGLGDALLYSVLPVFGKEMGFSIFFIGLLLSVNRFARILANTHIANVVNRFGMKKVLIICSVLAVITSALYGFMLGAILFLFARIAWGLSYSGLKIATLNYAASSKERSGFAFGLSKGIQAIGALFALYIGPIAIDGLGIKFGFFAVALLSSMGILLAFSLPSNNIETHPSKVKNSKTFRPSSMNLLVFVLSITVDGVLVVTLANLFAGNYSGSGQLLIGVSFYLLLKKIFVLVFSLVSGFLSLRISAIKLFKVSVILCVAGTLLVSSGFVIAGITIAFFFNTFIVTFSPLIAIERQSVNENSLQAISGISTWWDLGAALGAFAGIFLIELMGSQSLFITLSILIIGLFTNFNFRNANTNRTIV